MESVIRLLSRAVEHANARLGACLPASLAVPARVQFQVGARNSGTYAIGLIPWAVSEGLTVSLICHRPAPLKLQPYDAI